MMRDPLVHIIRNSIDHGIETPAERRAAGKRETGRLAVSRAAVGQPDHHRDRRRRRAASTPTGSSPRRSRDGPRDERELRALTRARRLDLIFEPGPVEPRRRSPRFRAAASAWTWCAPTSSRSAGAIELDNQPGQGPAHRDPRAADAVDHPDDRRRRRRPALRDPAPGDRGDRHGRAATRSGIDPLGGAARRDGARAAACRWSISASCSGSAATRRGAAMLAIVGVPRRQLSRWRSTRCSTPRNW